MEVSQKILAVMRIIEAIPAYDTSKRFGYIYNANKMMDDKDRAVLTDVVKAMILLTSGNQKAVRDPSTFDPDAARDKWNWLLGIGVAKMIQKFGLDIDLNSKPTREDYVIAHKLLPILGASKVSPEELEQHADMFTRDPLSRTGSEGHQKVYRGVTVSKNVILKATTRKTWNIGHGVSTSTSEKKGMEFAKTSMSIHGANGGPALLLNIENKSKRGFHAGSLSRYKNEREVILSGVLEFGDWDMDFKCRNAEGETMDASVHSTSQVASFSKMKQNDQGLMRPMVMGTETFPFKDGTTFQDFVDEAVGELTLNLTRIPGEWEVIESTILLKMNAVLQ
jgi:hypothetical protein|tara:strand:+ start:456 stop:1463 length:1008 start_codon:yes stop_codon:yes gene_type:complete